MNDSLAQPQENARDLRGRLSGLIESGACGPHGRLPPERQLCAQFGVSRRTVRRALEALAGEGLIWRRRGKGTFLGQPPEPTDLLAAEIAVATEPLEVMEARLCVEPELAALCARRARPEDVARMRRLAQRVAAARDPDLIELWDGALHRLIARAAGNRPLLATFSLLDEFRASEAWRHLRARARSLETLRESDRQHRAVIDAIAAADPTGAAAAMRAHLQTLAGNLERLVIGPERRSSLQGRKGAP